jgi:DNA (cytosine-5)-methyltransferase 1
MRYSSRWQWEIHGTDKTAKVMSFTDVAGSLRTKPPGSQENSSTTAVLAIGSRARGDDGRGYARPEHISHVAGTVDSTKPERVLADMQVRRLTPRECERLQGFPDDWTAIEYRGKPACDGPRYKAIGNSMAVPVMRWIGERLDAVNRVN